MIIVETRIPYNEKKLEEFGVGGFYMFYNGPVNIGSLIVNKDAGILEMKGRGKRKIRHDRIVGFFPSAEKERKEIPEEEVDKLGEVSIEGTTYKTELGCNCFQCDHPCQYQYPGEVVVLEIEGRPRYFAK